VAGGLGAVAAVLGVWGSASDEVVGDAGVLVPPRDADALASAIDALLGDDARRRSLAAAGRARVARYTWEAAARGTRDVYREAVESRR
jgi:glycosyltransferase involved in cell wall biosynthesis